VRKELARRGEAKPSAAQRYGVIMLLEVKVPQLSESVSEATLLSWHKKVGEAV
jgi:2-oxoglutarate dehydrogenase E2 component (dihydrolipoamide succinyltransferase)